jgi:membrane protease YdiL (CAAX protease family)
MSPPRSLLPFFGLVLVLSIPLWLLGYFATSLSDLIPIDLPVSALMAFLPATAALILVWREDGRAAVRDFLKRAVDYRRIPDAGWYALAILFMPGALFLAWLAMTLAGAPLPEPHLPLIALPVFFSMFFAAGLGEELGWQGFAFDRMPERWSALTAALIIGTIWVVWHLIPYFQLDRSIDWIAWHCGVTLLLRIVTVWLYVNGGRSVFIAALFHAMSNVAFFMFPNYGSHYDPAYFFWIVAAAVSAILLLGGPSLKHTRR